MRQAGVYRWFLLIAFGAMLVWARPADAQSVYTVNDIPMSARADDAVAAREQAIVAAEREGLRRLFTDLAGSASGVPDVADLPIDRFVRSYEIASEEVGAQSYSGRLNVTYAGDRVREALQGAGVAFDDRAVRPVLVVPAVRQGDDLALWWDADAWRVALEEAAAAERRLQILLPLGDAEDFTVLTPELARQGDSEALRRLGGRYGVQDVVVAIVDETGSQPSVDLLGNAGSGIVAETVRIDEGQVGGSLTEAATATVAALRRGLTAATAAPTGPVQSMAMVVPLADLASWVQIRQGLEGAPEVRALRVDRFARDRAELTMSFVGDTDTLREALARRGIVLLSENGEWHLLPADGRRPGAF
jgi:hypothetical protein